MISPASDGSSARVRTAPASLPCRTQQPRPARSRRSRSSRRGATRTSGASRTASTRRTVSRPCARAPPPPPCRRDEVGRFGHASALSRRLGHMRLPACRVGRLLQGQPGPLPEPRGRGAHARLRGAGRARRAAVPAALQLRALPSAGPGEPPRRPRRPLVVVVVRSSALPDGCARDAGRPGRLLLVSLGPGRAALVAL